MTITIAEAGINHNGDIELAKRLVDESVWAGADIVKFQTFHNIGRLKEYELSINDFIELQQYCDKKGIEFMTTPHSIESIGFVDTLVSMHKIASPYIQDEQYIRLIASKGKPVLLSTGCLNEEDGMATGMMITDALSWLKNVDVTLMHCVSKYPCSNPHYERIEKLRKRGVPVGISDHSKNIKLPRGLSFYEKHIMLEDVDCIDKDVSLTPSEFKEMVEWLKNTN
jgi:sialic acid synthase SpsE